MADCDEAGDCFWEISTVEVTLKQHEHQLKCHIENIDIPKPSATIVSQTRKNQEKVIDTHLRLTILGLFLGCSIPAFPKWGAATLQKSTGLGNSRWGNKCGVLGGLWKSETRYLLNIYLFFTIMSITIFPMKPLKVFLHCHSMNIQTMAPIGKAKLLSCEYKAAVADCSAVMISAGQYFRKILPKEKRDRPLSLAFDSFSVDHDWALPPPCMVCKGDSVELPSSCSDCSVVAPQQLAAVTLVFLPNLWHKSADLIEFCGFGCPMVILPWRLRLLP